MRSNHLKRDQDCSTAITAGGNTITQADGVEKSCLKKIIGILDDKDYAPRQSGAGWSALCPAHDDNNPSLSIREGNDGRVLLKCHAGCDTESVVTALDLTMADLFPPKKQTIGKRRGTLVKTYDYTDESGNLLFQACRFDPKNFSQRQPDGQGKWIYNLQGVRRVLYRLPELIAGAASGFRIYVAEGEKDVEALVENGFVATCNPMGAGKWKDEFSPFFAGVDVNVIVDKDEAGRKHALEVARSLHKVARACKVIELPDRGDFKVKDAADWFAAGGTAHDLQVIADQTLAIDLTDESSFGSPGRLGQLFPSPSQQLAGDAQANSLGRPGRVFQTPFQQEGGVDQTNDHTTVHSTNNSGQIGQLFPSPSQHQHPDGDQEANNGSEPESSGTTPLGWFMSHYRTVSGGIEHAFVYANGQMVDLHGQVSMTGFPHSCAFGINNNGQICGQITSTPDFDSSFLAGTNQAFFLDTNGSVTRLTSFGGSSIAAFCINDSGLVVGASQINSANDDMHAFKWLLGDPQPTDLNTNFTIPNQWAMSVNAQGDITGFSALYYNGWAFTIQTNVFRDLSEGYYWSWANAINSQGQIVGGWDGPQTGYNARALFWQDSQYFDLNSLLPTNSGWVLNQGVNISQYGQIVGTGTFHGTSCSFAMPAPTGTNQIATNIISSLNAAGSDTFTYTVTDGINMATAIVYVTITPPNWYVAPWQAADLNNSDTGILTVFIDAPSNGAALQ